MKSFAKWSSILLLFFCFAASNAKTKVDITVENTTGIDRTIETVELDWKTLADKGLKAGKTIIVDKAGNEVTSQLLLDTKGEATSLIFQVELKANSSQTFTATKSKPADYTSNVYCRMVPERYNDFAWENNIVGYRIYQEVLIPIDGPSGGIDVWTKRTDKMVINKWYKDTHYHTDHGEGCDSYKVGPTMGAGSISLLEDGKVKLHANYKEADIRAMGPIRVIVDFTFGKQTIDGESVEMTKTLTFDANSSLNKFDVTYKSKLEELNLVTGITKRDGAGEMYFNEKNGVLSYWEPEIPNLDEKGLGIISPESSKMGTLENHVVAYASTKTNTPFTYYTGACWDRAKFYNNSTEWIAYLETYRTQLDAPLNIIIK